MKGKYLLPGQECFLFQEDEPPEPFKIGSRSLGRLMLADYEGVVSGKYAPDESASAEERMNYFKDREWLLEQGEKVRSSLLCPQCKEKTASEISIISGGDFALDGRYLCCGFPDCRAQLRTTGAVEKGQKFYPLCFSSILKFSRKGDRDKFLRFLIKDVLKIERCTEKEARKLFKRDK